VYELLKDTAPAPTAAIMHPRTSVGYAKLADTTGQPMRRPQMIESLPFLSTTGVSITEEEGASGAIASRVYVGHYPHLYVGIRSALRVEVLRELFASNYQFAFLAHLRADVQLAHVESFATLRGIIP
jgi:HK97 family phage major capsid protein